MAVSTALSMIMIVVVNVFVGVLVHLTPILRNYPPSAQPWRTTFLLIGKFDNSMQRIR